MADKETIRQLELQIERLRQEVSQKEAEIREIQELALIGNWQWDLRQHTLSWSDAVYRIFGHEPGCLKPSVEMLEAAIHPDDRESFLQLRRMMLEEENSASMDYRIILPDGAIRYIQDRTRLIFDDQGRLCHVIGTVQDITARKQAEEAIKVSRRFFRIVSQCREMESLLEEFATELHRFTGCAAVGIRMVDETGRIPFRTANGFSRQFMDLDGTVSIQSDRCACVLVIQGGIGPAVPGFTFLSILTMVPFLST